MKHTNNYCNVDEMITCTHCDSDYDAVSSLKENKKILHIPPQNEEEKKRLKEYNELMKKYCPDFEEWPTTEEELKQMIHEKAIALSGGIENLNFAKVLVGEMTLEEAEEDIKAYHMSKKDELLGAKVLPIKSEDYYDEPSRLLTECDDVDVKNKLIWFDQRIHKRLNDIKNKRIK